MMSYHGPISGYTWMLALLGSLALVLILVSAVLLYYKRVGAPRDENDGFLAAKTVVGSSDYQCRQVTSVERVVKWGGHNLFFCPSLIYSYPAECESSVLDVDVLVL